MHQHMMQQMFAPVAPPASRPGLSVHEVDDSGRTMAALPPAQGPLMGLGGFGGLGGLGGRGDFGDSILSSAGGSAVSSFSSFTSFSSTGQGGGQPIVYRSSTSTRSVGGVTESMHEEFDSRTQKERLAVKRAVLAPGQLERGRIVARERHLGTQWDDQKVDTLVNLQEHEIDSFDSEWRQRAQVRRLNGTLCEFIEITCICFVSHAASGLATDPRASFSCSRCRRRLPCQHSRSFDKQRPTACGLQQCEPARILAN